MTTWKSLCAVYKIMNSKWKLGFTNRPSNYINNFCSPIWFPVTAFSSQINSTRWNSSAYDAYLWSTSYQTWGEVSFLTTQWQETYPVLHFHFWFTHREESTERQNCYRKKKLVSFLLCSVVSILWFHYQGYFLLLSTFKLSFSLTHTHTHTTDTQFIKVSCHLLHAWTLKAFSSVNASPFISLQAPGDQVPSASWPLCSPHTVSVQ